MRPTCRALARWAVFDKARTDPAWRLRVADAGEDMHGYVAAEPMEKPETALRKPHTEGHIHHISVDPAAHRTGVGRALARHAIAGLTEQSADRITVGYWAFNKSSEALFRSLGFEPASIYAEQS